MTRNDPGHWFEAEPLWFKTAVLNHSGSASNQWPGWAAAAWTDGAVSPTCPRKLGPPVDVTYGPSMRKMCACLNGGSSRT